MDIPTAPMNSLDPQAPQAIGPGWLRPEGTVYLPEVHRSITIPAGASFWRKLLAFSGPGFLVAVGYMDPGTRSSCSWRSGGDPQIQNTAHRIAISGGPYLVCWRDTSPKDGIRIPGGTVRDFPRSHDGTCYYKTSRSALCIGPAECLVFLKPSGTRSHDCDDRRDTAAPPHFPEERVEAVRTPTRARWQ